MGLAHWTAGIGPSCDAGRLGGLCARLCCAALCLACAIAGAGDARHRSGSAFAGAACDIGDDARRAGGGGHRRRRTCDFFAQWKWVERSFLPVAIILQVTPIIAIAPLLLIYLEASTAVLACAFLVAFFPILSNTALGLASTDRNLVDLFQLYRASRWRTLLLLRLPAALPYFLGGLRIGGGLALIGAIAAELAAGAAGKGAGLAFRIVEAGYRLNIPRMFAALTLISLTGIAIFLLLSVLSGYLLGRWHESALGPER